MDIIDELRSYRICTDIATLPHPICGKSADYITNLLVKNQSLRNAANEFKAHTQRSRDASVSEKPLMGFHVPSDAFDPKNGIESWPSEYKHPKRKKMNQNVEDKKGEKNG